MSSSVSGARPRVTRFRVGRLGLLAVGFALVCAIPLAVGQPPWTLLVLLLPLLAAVWILRTGVDVSASGLVARGMLGRRSIPWERIGAVRIGPRSSLWIVRTDGSQVKLPSLSARDLPRLYQVTGGRIGIEEPPAQSPAQ